MDLSKLLTLKETSGSEGWRLLIDDSLDDGRTRVSHLKFCGEGKLTMALGTGRIFLPSLYSRIFGVSDESLSDYHVANTPTCVRHSLSARVPGSGEHTSRRALASQ